MTATVGVGLLGAGVETGSAQQIAVPPPPDTILQGPRAIAPGAIPNRADVVAADLRRMENFIQPDRVIVRIGEALNDRDVRVVALLAILDSIDSERVSLRRVEDQRLPWLELRAELEVWGGRVRARFSELQRERERIRDERALWELTLEGAEEAEIPPELLGRVETTLTRVGDVELRVREARDRIGFLADRIATMEDQVTEALRRLDALAEVERARMLERSDATLLSTLQSASPTQLKGGLARAGGNWWRSLTAHAAHYRGRLALTLMVYLVLLAQAFHLRRRSRAQGVEGGSRQTWRTLAERPFSLALALALATGSLVVPLAPGAFRDLIVVLSVLPVLRIGAVVLETAVHRSMRGIAVLTIVTAFAGVDFGVTLERLTLALTTIIGLMVATGVALDTRRWTETRQGWARVARVLIAASAALLAGAFTAGALGWVGLALLLTQAGGERLYAAMSWAIVVLAASALARGGLDGPLGRVLPRVARSAAGDTHVLERILSFVAVLVWTRGTLNSLHLWQPAREIARVVTGSALSIGGLTLSTGGLLGAILILALTRFFARAVTLVAREEILPRTRIRGGAAESAVTLTTYSIYGVGVVLAASAVGLGGTQLTVVIGALGVGIGFGLQNIVNNFVSGLILIFERPISVGDAVQTANQWGRVERIGIRASTIRSYDGAEIIVPNGDLVSHEIINWTRSDEIRRVEVFVGVAYETEPAAVLDVLRRTAAEHPHVLDEPPPVAHMIKFGDSSLDFRLRVWVRFEHWVDVIGDLHLSIHAELGKSGIRIPFPQRDVHVYPTGGGVDPLLPAARQTTTMEDFNQ